MAVVVEVIEALAELPPGPQLAAALADIDVAQVPNNELLPLLTAQSRQSAHESARLLAVIAEVGRANPTFDDNAIDRLDHPFRHAADEVRAALSWSRRAAEGECAFAEQVVHHLPVVHAAFLVGEIDRPKVRVFADHLSGLTETQVATICAAVVPLAGRLTPGQLVVRLRRLVAAIDPRHYERRYRKALRDRTVCAWLDEDGTAVLSARGLSPAQAEAALERIDGLAHAARRAGHPSTLDQIRVDVLAGLLDGTLHHLRREEIVAHLIVHRSMDDAGGAGIQASEQDAAGPRAGRAATPASPADMTTAGDGGSASDGASPSDGRSADEDQRVGIEVRVALSSLLGDDEQPGEIPGLGPIPAGHAREVVARQRRAEWRIAVTNAEGRLLVDGITRRRPTGLAPDGPPGGVVELQVPAAMLPRLTRADRAVDPAVAAWAGVLADIARQHAERDRRDLDAHPDDRLPRAALRRHTEIRDRACVGVGCRHRPQRCDQDHTVDHQHGGKTVAGDLAPLCRHDHTLKHEAGWTLDQPLPGTFVWTSPLGGRYDVKPEPVLPPLPQPCPAPDDPGHDQPATAGPDTLTLWRPDPPPPPPEPDPIDPDEPPPF
jgi:hypothetical protein